MVATRRGTPSAEPAASAAAPAPPAQEIGLLVAPLRTLSLFASGAAELALSAFATAAVHPAMLFAGYPLLLGWLATHLAAPHLYAPPTCHGFESHAPAAAGGALYLPSLYAYEFAWWLVLGILSSIGFGSGLHSGIMFLWPFVMRVVSQAQRPVPRLASPRLTALLLPSRCLPSPPPPRPDRASRRRQPRLPVRRMLLATHSTRLSTAPRPPLARPSLLQAEIQGSTRFNAVFNHPCRASRRGAHLPEGTPATRPACAPQVPLRAPRLARRRHRHILQQAAALLARRHCDTP